MDEDKKTPSPFPPPLPQQGRPAPDPEPEPREFSPPPALQGQYRQLYAYLTQMRGIPSDVVQQLVRDGLLYQDAEHNNAVFINPAHTFAEIRGTNTFKAYHQVMFSTPEAFWWFKTDGLDSIPTIAYICEGAIDAISLYVLRRNRDLENGDNGLYCSIGGVANQQRIDAIKAGMFAAGCPVIIAVDNDEAGVQCRQRNPDCHAWIPIPAAKDWNEQLQIMKKE